RFPASQTTRPTISTWRPSQVAGAAAMLAGFTLAIRSIRCGLVAQAATRHAAAATARRANPPRGKSLLAARVISDTSGAVKNALYQAGGLYATGAGPGCKAFRHS